MTQFLTSLVVLGMLIAPQLSGGIILVEQDHHPEISELFLYDVRLYLEQNQPYETGIYAIMSYNINRNGEFISLAALRADTQPPYSWRLEDGNVIGTITLQRTPLGVDVFDPQPRCRECALPQTAFAGPGGGPEIYLPWEAGKKVIFGPRGVHDAGLVWPGSVAVDFVSGNVFGADYASDMVYASAAGTVSDVCDDGVSKYYKVTGNDNSIGYFHFDTTATLEQGDPVTRGQAMGRLKRGNFDDNCGWAAYGSQADQKWHLHWVIIPSNSQFRAEGWTLYTQEGRWKRGNETVSINQALSGGGGISTPGTGGVDDTGTGTGTIVVIPGEAVTGGGARFWDYIIAGANSLYGVIKPGLPRSFVNENNEQMWAWTLIFFRTLIQDANLYFVNDTLNLMPFIYIGGIVLAAEGLRYLLFGTVWLVSMIKLFLKWW